MIPGSAVRAICNHLSMDGSVAEEKGIEWARRPEMMKQMKKDREKRAAKEEQS